MRKIALNIGSSQETAEHGGCLGTPDNTQSSCDFVIERRIVFPELCREDGQGMHAQNVRNQLHTTPHLLKVSGECVQEFFGMARRQESRMR